MAGALRPHLEILPPAQRRLWAELGSTPASFVLYGGTAIALHLGHRTSVDFDFFSDQDLDQDQLLIDVPYLANAVITHREPNTLSCRVDRGGPVQLSFFGLPRLRRLRPPILAPDNGLPVADLFDLAGAKAAVVQVRAEAKDYLDIDALMTMGGIELTVALACAQLIHGCQFNAQVTLKALSYFDDGNVSSLPAATKDRLAQAARRVDLDGLPAIMASISAAFPGGRGR